MVPVGDQLPRGVCPSCEKIHYENPKVVTGCLVESESKVLLCRRAIEPRIGFWTFPAGYLEMNESTQAGAIRETKEEAGADVQIEQLYALFDLPYMSQIYMFYKASLQSFSFTASSETTEARFFSEGEIPWDQLAFKVVTETLNWFFEDRKTSDFAMHTMVIDHPTLKKLSAPSST